MNFLRLAILLSTFIIIFFFKSAHPQILALNVFNYSTHETFIIHVQKPPKSTINMLTVEDYRNYHRSFLPTHTLASGEPRLIYSYHNAISGFAAKLTRDEAKAIEKVPGVLRADPDRALSLHTTHVNDFLGINHNSCFMRDTESAMGAIIGILDAGVLPTHPSFTDRGIAHPPPPGKWRGHCDFKPAMCNNKIVGAKSFNHAGKGLPFDFEGHGTHTASVAAGGIVKNADVLGNARGTAAGAAPRAHLAIYKVCHSGGCLASDVLAGIDQAIADGVDVISLSLGGPAIPFYDDAVAIGALAAIERGIFVSSSAGNSGPARSTVGNDAPWMLTAGASSMDRAILATVRLGNGEEFDGESSYQPIGFTSILLPIVYPGARGGSRVKTCSDGSLNRINVRGKIVLCHTGGTNTSIEKGAIVMRAGGVAMIVVNEEKRRCTVEAEAHVLPTAHVSTSAGGRIIAYLRTMRENPTAVILFKGTVYGNSPAPAVAAFSGRGPSAVNEGIMKPDIVGPGVNILAAWPFPVGPPVVEVGNVTTPTFNVVSGTSASAALLAGVAALLKISHPEWSPAEIKSALMTTADVLDRDGGPIADETLGAAGYLAAGAGQVNPTRANDPGLVYDIQPGDYVRYLCGLGYTDMQVSAISRRAVKCAVVDSMAAEDLNYPAVSVAMGTKMEKTVTRTVRNVCEEEAVYTAKIRAPEGVEASVYPEKLGFSEKNQSMSYNVYLSSGEVGGRRGSVGQGLITWVSNKHIVRSPLLVSFA
ncbi:Subtilisin-like protease SDD1 [Apostasia shenzhenica]|uniref:Subtilisin-like protease SDD1 n=1 Tax=Apostasia shenzhenica TaxID=1088818 RepID=A0A2I0BBG9_9ASPA|nr:Subtilisin-like protease SDD1 [Apostasia shenzhenica]